MAGAGGGLAPLLDATSSYASPAMLRVATEALEGAETRGREAAMLKTMENKAAFEHLRHLERLVLDAGRETDADGTKRRWAVRLVAAVALSVVAWPVRVLQAMHLEEALNAEALADMRARAYAKVHGQKARPAARKEQSNARRKKGKTTTPRKDERHEQGQTESSEGEDGGGEGDDVADGADALELDAPPLHFSVLLALSRCIATRLSGSDVLELCDDDVARSAWAALVLMETGASLSDGRNLVVLGTRLLFSLTTFGAHCGGVAEVATSNHLKELTSRFARRNTELLRAVMELDAFDSIASAVHPLFSRNDAAEEAHAAAQSACRLVHNLLLFSTESTCQLRKCLAHSRFFSAVLDPHLDAIARAKDLDARPALKALCAITFKVCLLQQHYLANARLLANVLELRDDDATTVELVCRVACNLGLLQASGDHVACLKLTVEATAAALSAETRASARRRFWIDTATAPVTRGEATHAWVVSVLGDAEFCKVEEDGLSRRQRRNRLRRQRRQQWRTWPAASLAAKLKDAAATETRHVQVHPRLAASPEEVEEEAGEGFSDFDVDDVLAELGGAL